MVDRNKAQGYAYRFVKGPLYARQLGRCLVVNAVRDGCCNLDCVYCPYEHRSSGKAEAGSFVTRDHLYEEVRRKMRSKPEIDYVVLTGDGEPTLHPDLNSVAAWFDAHMDTRMALVTNGTRLHTPAMLHTVNRMDLIMLSLDAFDEDSFQRFYRPRYETTFAEHMHNLETFRAGYLHRLWLQVFLVRGYSFKRDHLLKLIAAIQRLQPDRVVLTTGPMAGAEAFKNRVSMEVRKKVVDYIVAATGVATDFDDLYDGLPMDEALEHVFRLLERSSFSLRMLAQNIHQSPAETTALLEPIVEAGAIRCYEIRGEPHYYLCHNWCRPSLKYQLVKEEAPPEIDFNRQIQNVL